MTPLTCTLVVCEEKTYTAWLKAMNVQISIGTLHSKHFVVDEAMIMFSLYICQAVLDKYHELNINAYHDVKTGY